MTRLPFRRRSSRRRPMWRFTTVRMFQTIFHKVFTFCFVVSTIFFSFLFYKKKSSLHWCRPRFDWIRLGWQVTGFLPSFFFHIDFSFGRFFTVPIGIVLSFTGFLPSFFSQISTRIIEFFLPILFAFTKRKHELYWFFI